MPLIIEHLKLKFWMCLCSTYRLHVVPIIREPLTVDELVVPLHIIRV